MMWKDLFELVIVVALSGWLFYKFYKTRKNITLFAAVLVMCLQFRQWPLFFPQKLSLVIIGLFCATFSLYRYYKNRKESLYLGLGLILFLFSFVFAADMFFPRGASKTIAKNNVKTHIPK